MKKTLTILALSALLFTACKKEETTDSAPPEETVADGTAVTTDSVTEAAATTTATPELQPLNGAPAGSVMTTQPGAAAKSYSTTPAPVAKGMNPAHGQPGHRCDIAVGAPLNSPPGKTPTATSAPVSQSTTVTPAMMTQNGQLTPNTTTTVTPAAPTTPVVTAPGMNPPHGQEGHVCSVAVGAPLPKN